MKLIKVEAQGFKSFADRVCLEFDGGVVGIVGPNGSGKSNINDAIKWVLGEQSSKALRGDSMEDVIFAGSKTVKEMDRAEVVLTFDNSDGALNIPHKTFTISRVLKRGKGANEYYVNGELARSKDIKDIAMESGISKSSLAIISQGTISDIAEASPEQRRGIIEEAAGTSKYKARKVEALRKLDQTSEALDKVKTIIAELERQLIPLRKKAEKAKIYLEKSKALESIEVALIVEELSLYGNRLEELKIELSGVEETRVDLESDIRNFEDNLLHKTSYKNNLDSEINKISSNLETIEKELNNIQLAKKEIETKRNLIISGELKVSPEERIKAIKEQLEDLNRKNNLFTNLIEKNSREKESIDKELSILEQNLSIKKHEISSLTQKRNSLRTKLEIMREQKNNRTNLFKGTKNIIENSHLFKGYKGTVADLIKIDQNFIPAIESILNNALQHIVVDVPETAVKAVEFLKKNNAGRATFIPLSSIQGKYIREDHQLVLKKQKGFVGIASELVGIDPEFEVLRDFLLGNILVTQTIEDANKISKLMNLKYMVVSLDGDIIRVGGVISGGVKQESSNMIGLEEKIKEVEANLPLVQEKINLLTNEMSKEENKKTELIAKNNQYFNDNTKIQFEHEQVKSALSKLSIEYNQLSNEEHKLNSEFNVDDNLEKLEVQKMELQAELASKRETIKNLGDEITTLTLSKQNKERELRKLQTDFQHKTNERNRAEYYVNSIRRRLSEHYQMTLEMASENYKLEIGLEAAKEFVENLKQEIKELGNVDPDSIKHCEEVEERYNNLKSNEEELEKAKNTILDAINELDKLIITKIQDTVAIVNEEFGKVFKAMFGGGDAKVQYSDPENILETGIEIMAQPPGKKVKNLKLFSGGEKAIIAISLLFAIIKAKPIPLCILDEVEAALDEANVIRYAEFLQTLKDKTQFLVITHRHGTMSRVDHLFGATMQKRGVTSFFTVELSKAKKLLQDNPEQ